MNLKQEDKKFIIWAIVAFVVAAGLGVFWYLNRDEGLISPESQEEEKELSKEEILERLSVPEGAEQQYVSDSDFVEKNSAPANAEFKYVDDEEFIQRFSAPADAQPKYIK